MKESDWKARAEAAEAELARRAIADFERVARECIGSKEPMRKRMATLTHALAELIGSPVSAEQLSEAMKRWQDSVGKTAAQELLDLVT